MKRFKLKLIIVLSIVLVIFFIGISMYTSYIKIEDTVEEAIANQNLEAAKSIAKAIDLETYERFLKERNRDEDYWTIRHYLNDAREKLGVLYVYTLEIDNSTTSKVLIVGYPDKKDNPNDFLIGEACTVPEAQVKLAYEEGKPFVTEILQDTKYGHHYKTVGTPIMNEKGEIISYLSIDISTDTLDGIKETVINSNIFLLVLSGLFVIIVIISFFLLQKWYQKEVGTTEYTYQKEIKTLIASVSSLRHDYINHIQVLHGFLHIGEVDQATKYVDSLSKDIQTIESIKLNLDHPGLAILLQTKKLTCQNQQIDIQITVEDNPFNNIKTIDLINILSNIIDNAIEATMELPEELRKITVSCKADELYYTFSITNAGRKLPDINQIFKQGYSTKKVEKGRVRGQGLFIVKETINKYNGTITLDTINEKETIAIVKIPSK
ncbi:predicted signal transduction protein with a C-terminal ATPase domain [Solibacillus silvestris StLB046]|uniref:Predicted signal transduction protein with a C-terminal ATPase domain n=1 Tax=Solibacillus silvestris (strain StLB046) TaxID=1002809 RepID=F2F0U7_SOLSS|nr:Spo0B domain-containing protein [Solibacillus silvestris]BAK16341.1 predicted signal transduction protein with a C-terminal ATPase domain [Solibacillus silvestris StLB046]